MAADDSINELKKRFNAEAARNVTATYLLNVRGEGAGSWLAKIKDGQCEFIKADGNGGANGADCTVSIDAEDLDMILAGRLSVMTAAMSGVLAIDGEIGLAMQLVPIFFEGQGPFI